MTRRWSGFTSVLASGITQFLAHKRALGRRYQVEEAALRLFDQFLGAKDVTTLDAITPAIVDAFLQSRPRLRPRSYNHLRGALARCFDWLVVQGQVPASPVQAPCRRVTGHRLPVHLRPSDRKTVARPCRDTAGQCPRAAPRRHVPRVVCVALWPRPPRRRSVATRRR